MIDGKETIPQVAARWNLTPAYVRMLIKQGRIADAVKIGRDWYLPAGAERPKMRPYGTKRHPTVQEIVQTYGEALAEARATEQDQPE